MQIGGIANLPGHILGDALGRPFAGVGHSWASRCPPPLINKGAGNCPLNVRVRRVEVTRGASRSEGSQQRVLQEILSARRRTRKHVRVAEQGGPALAHERVKR